MLHWRISGAGVELLAEIVTRLCHLPSPQSVMTRRTAMLLGLGIPAFAYPPREFWNEKKPDDWTEDERQELLTRSPWAREAEVKNNSPAGIGAPRPTSGMNRRMGGGSTVRGTIPDASSAPQGRYTAVVRWDSAVPIREALHNQSKDDPAANYILCVSGDLPMLGRRGNDEGESEYQQRLDMLKQYTKLQKKGDFIYLNKIGYHDGPPSVAGTLFYFERNDLIRLEDRQVTFVTKLGPLDVKAKFALHDMMYLGKLEL
jgi:hypothetical protein